MSSSHETYWSPIQFVFFIVFHPWLAPGGTTTLQGLDIGKIKKGGKSDACKIAK